MAGFGVPHAGRGYRVTTRRGTGTAAPATDSASSGKPLRGLANHRQILLSFGQTREPVKLSVAQGLRPSEQLTEESGLPESRFMSGPGGQARFTVPALGLQPRPRVSGVRRRHRQRGPAVLGHQFHRFAVCPVPGDTDVAGLHDQRAGRLPLARDRSSFVPLRRVAESAEQGAARAREYCVQQIDMMDQRSAKPVGVGGADGLAGGWQQRADAAVRGIGRAAGADQDLGQA